MQRLRRLILDGLVLNGKADATPARLGRDEISQLAATFCSIKTTRFGVNRIGLDLSRQGAMVIWTVGDFLHLLGAIMPVARLPLRLRLHTVSTFEAPHQRGWPRVAAITPRG